MMFNGRCIWLEDVPRFLFVFKGSGSVLTRRRRRTQPYWRRRRRRYTTIIRDREARRCDRWGSRCHRGWCTPRLCRWPRIIPWRPPTTSSRLTTLRRTGSSTTRKSPSRAKSSGKSFTNSARRWSSRRAAGKRSDTIFFLFLIYIFTSHSSLVIHSITVR